MKKVETAVLSRIHSIEFPFFNGFLAHYLDRLGFDRVFLIHGEKADPAPLQARIERQGFADRVEILQPAAIDNADTILNEFLPFLKARCEWLLLADVDEYVHLAGRNIKSVLADHAGHREVHFRSMMVVSTAKAPAGYRELVRSASVFPKWLSKTIFRIAEVVKITTHVPYWKKESRKLEFIHEMERPIKKSLFEFHFASRGLFDVLLRSICQNFGPENPKSGKAPNLKKFLMRRGDVAKVKEVPTRFLVMMIQVMEDRSARPMIRKAGRIAEVMLGDARFDVDLLRQMLAHALDTIDVSATIKKKVLDDQLLPACLDTVIDRFWNEDIRQDLDSLNYLKLVKKMRGEAY